ncbi:RNA-directed DNA polymerase, eukaryota, Reverse transcriptase zinc-binding domain protein [Artemisia annua]|uniref:RNA-directed DNA polymerase, eukaryota, Reverse transcriptase zinc-binding domain protein n=1 Tax=Artemisia annua TaxID=35608 RepID=A0A2U1KS05_ARTAN|nr:RNA-directed DNA polymerase, eukaryota, Reverse transcriptase zinc-binding domain protein [Artemisia annua]
MVLKKALGMESLRVSWRLITLVSLSWGLHSSRKFSVQSLSTIIHDRILDSSILGRKFPWNSWIPKKVNICLWRASLDRLPSKPNVYTRGIPVSSILCPLCYSEIELSDHCLINCPLVKSVWAKVGAGGVWICRGFLWMILSIGPGSPSLTSGLLKLSVALLGPLFGISGSGEMK